MKVERGFSVGDIVFSRVGDARLRMIVVSVYRENGVGMTTCRWFNRKTGVFMKDSFEEFELRKETKE